MVTNGEAMEQGAAYGGPQAAGLLADIFAQQASHREAVSPTWEQLEREKGEAYADGFADGYARARAEIVNRLLNGTGLPPRNLPADTAGDV